MIKLFAKKIVSLNQLINKSGTTPLVTFVIAINNIVGYCQPLSIIPPEGTTIYSRPPSENDYLNGVFPVNTTAVIKCLFGYRIQNHSLVTCAEPENWSGINYPIWIPLPNPHCIGENIIWHTCLIYSF